MHTYSYDKDFLLESGEVISKLKIAYHTYGTLNTAKSNVIWVFHAFSANSDVSVWWPGMFGANCLLNPEKYFIVCANILGSPYGSSAPHDMAFPQFTLRDVVNTHFILAEKLGITKIYMAVGGSIGGNQALEFAYSFKGKIENLVLVACCARESPWAIAIHEAQRMALLSDPTFEKPNGGKAGLETARAIGMLTYRTPSLYNEKQADDDSATTEFKAASYIRYQGKKFSSRFSALSYYYLTKCMDSHNIGRGRGGEKKALSKITIPALVIGIDTDMMIPAELQKNMARAMPNGMYKEIQSTHGHDGFLTETEKLTELISKFLK